MALETRKTYCSMCSAFCGMQADIEDGRVTALRGDPDHPMSAGFTCGKGRQFHELLTAEDRLQHAAIRRRDGSLSQSGADAAITETVAKLRKIIESHGPEAVAIYMGNGCTFKTTPLPTAHGFMQGLGSHQLYSSLTIDQPAKIVATGRHGVWAGGGPHFDDADVCLLFGNNPVVSGLSMNGAPPGWRPSAIKAARKRGLKFWVVDPRRTETAKLADRHLAIKPGRDPVLLAGMIRLILENNWQDQAFCDSYCSGLEQLKSLVAPFDLPRVSQLTDLAEADIEALTRDFATAKRGNASSGTGPDMAPDPNLTEHLILSLNSLCGRHNRAGDISRVPSLLTPDLPPMAMVVPADFLPDKINPAKNTRRSRLSGAHQVYSEMPTATLANEILTPGDGQIRALIVIGGNPVMSWPDAEKTRKALSSLDLLVAIETRHSPTTMLADILLPASYGLERGEMTAFNDFVFDRAYHQYSAAIVPPPGEAREEWQWLQAIAQGLGIAIPLPGGDLAAGDYSDDGDLYELLFPPGSTKVPVRELMAAADDHIWEQFEGVEVQPGLDGMEDRLAFAPEGLKKEFAALELRLQQDAEVAQAFTHQLISRRNAHVYNSMGHNLSKTPRTNPAWLNPKDIAALGCRAGDKRRLESPFGHTLVELAEDPDLRRGVVSISHGWGAAPVERGKGSIGTAVAELLSTDHSADPWVNMPVMSALPLRFTET